MARCPHCQQGFQHPTVQKIPRGTSAWGFLTAYTATCPRCDVVLGVFGG
ncbi:MAG: hypothetical protein ACPGQL_02635 [Thermoplasmatota archaeon]